MKKLSFMLVVLLTCCIPISVTKSMIVDAEAKCEINGGLVSITPPKDAYTGRILCGNGALFTFEGLVK